MCVFRHVSIFRINKEFINNKQKLGDSPAVAPRTPWGSQTPLLNTQDLNSNH